MKKVLRTLAVIAAVAMIATTLIVPASAEVTGGLWAEVCLTYDVVRIINGSTAVNVEPVAWMIVHPEAGSPDFVMNNPFLPDNVSGGRAATVGEVLPVGDIEDGIRTYIFAQDDYTLGANVMLGFFHDFGTPITSLADAEARMGDSVAIEYFAYCTRTAPEPGTPEPGTPEPGEPGTPEPGTPEPGTPEPGTPAPGTPAPATAAATTATTGDTAPATGIALAIIPTVIAAGAAIVAAKKRK